MAVGDSHKSFEAVLTEEQLADPELREVWQRLAPARAFAETLLRFRAEHGLGQRALAERLGVSQPRVVKLESGEHNPDVETIINAVRTLDVEFMLDISPSGRAPELVAVALPNRVEHESVSVVAASSP